MRDDYLFDILKEAGFDEAFAGEVIDAGYFLHKFAEWDGANPYFAVMDGFYGNKRSGIIKIDDFIAHLKGETLPKPTRTTAVYHHVSNANHVFEILEQDRHKHLYQKNFLSFRGQAGNHLRGWSGDRLIKRNFPIHMSATQKEWSG